jgi:hypothetical protein
MREKRINKLINDIFYDVADTEEVREQKEELRIHVTERVQDYMAQGMDFDSALAQARDGLGDPEELINGFERKKVVVVEEVDDDYGINFNFRVSRLFTKLVALSPFIYVILGATQNSWRPMLPFEIWNWWMWGWVIIPVFGILSSGIGLNTFTAISPFVYVALGFILGGNWWLWGWVIIPASGILFSGGGCGKKKKKKKKEMWTEYTDKNGKKHWKFMSGSGFTEEMKREIDEAMDEAHSEISDAVKEVKLTFSKAGPVDHSNGDRRN